MRTTSWPAGTGFIANRIIVGAALSGILGAFLVVADRMTKAGLSSQIDIGSAVAAALVTGILVQANYRRLVGLIDRIFLPRRYAASVALGRIRESLLERRSDYRKHVARNLADALGLASVAIFMRTSDGGFVRQAAHGWPSGTAWHLLPGETLTASLDGGTNVVSIPRDAASDLALPEAEARPLIAVTFRRRGQMRGAILLGPDRSGGTPDADTVRGVAALLGELLVA